MSVCRGKASPALSPTQHPCMEQCDQLLTCWRLWDQGIKSVPWRQQLANGTCVLPSTCISAHVILISWQSVLGEEEFHRVKSLVSCGYLALPMMALVCLHPLFFSRVVSVLEKTIWVSWVSLAVTEGRRKLGKGRMADRTRGGGQHHLVMLPLRSPPSQTGAIGLMDAALVLTNPACLVLLLSSAGSTGTDPHWDTAWLAVTSWSSATGHGMLSRK